MQNHLVYLNNRAIEVVYRNEKLQKSKAVQEGDRVYLFKSSDNVREFKQILLKWLKSESKKIIIGRTKTLSETFGFEFNRIAIKDAKTRWGSCSSGKNLNFSWRLALAPSDIMDYVIIHELCHLKEMNHSKQFWNLVASICPTYKPKRKWLKENGNKLMNLI